MNMRKDSQIFLKKILDYRNSTGENNFELNYKYFDDIPSVETAIYDILDDLISNNCLTSKSQVTDLEGNISINLTLDGITYFDDEKEKNSAVIFNVSGGQINIAKENAKIDVIMNNIESAKDQKKKDVLVNNVYQDNEQKGRTDEKVFKEKCEEINDLFDTREYGMIFDSLKELKKYAFDKTDIFWVDFLYGKYYLFLFEEEKTNKKKNLDNAMKFFEKSIGLMSEDKKELYEECHRYIINCYIRMGEVYEEAEWYEKGIQYCEMNLQELIDCDKKNSRRYTAILDYALLLVESSRFNTKVEAQKKLEKAFSFFSLIYKIEEVHNHKVDKETLYRYFVNAGRCCQLLAEYDGYEEYLEYAIEFYEQLMEITKISLREQEKYGLIYNNMGNIYALQFCRNTKDKEKIEKAKECYEKASKAYEAIGDKKSYYECLSNKARTMISLYNVNGNNDTFYEIENLLKEIINNRLKLEIYAGAYISKVHLAQLYVKYAKINQSREILRKAQELYDDALEFYTKDYNSDMYYKICYGCFEVKSLLFVFAKELSGIYNNIEDMLKLLKKEFNDMTDFTRNLYIEQIVKDFFIYVDNNGSVEKRENLYHIIENDFKQMDLDVNKYIQINK